MKKIYVAAAAIILVASGYLLFGPEDRTVHEFERTQLSDVFYAEGGAIGDVDGDGTPDVVVGPFWYAGPDFQERHEFIEPTVFDVLEYSDKFFAHVYDFNGDGRNDILVIGFPGEAAYWYENPQDDGGHWERHLAYPTIDDESVHIEDFTGDGRPEIVHLADGYMGYTTFDPDRPTDEWTFHPVTEQHEWGRYTHGLGTGDVDGDGLPDLILAEGWWENPGFDSDDLWTYHEVDFGPGGAHMHAYDVNGDGRNDVITSLEAHGYGLAWFEQLPDGTFERHLIMGEEIEDSPYGVRFTQPHALKVADIDGDGLLDIVTGKRWYAHGDHGDPESQAPAVLYWFKLDRSEDGDVSFIPYLIDDDSGVGVDVTIGHFNDDGLPDILVVNKKGAFVFHHQTRMVSASEWEDAQPQLLSDAN
ncbi:MAG: VCBS repeat-containing protein [Rhodothermales bacterium]